MRLKKHILYTIWLITLGILCTPVQAIVNLELTKGVKKAIPIAIVPLQGEPASKPFTTIISNDLSHSGEFSVLPSDQLPQISHQPSQINIQAWQNLHVNNVAVGQAHSGAVNFQLMDIYSANPQALILDQRLSGGNSEAGIRKTAHQIADVIYEKLTGKKGIFSTRIIYVLVKNPFQKNRHYQLIMADVDGYNPRPLFGSSMPIMSPAWSPNGGKVAYVSFEGGEAGIYVQDIANGGRRKISGQQGVNGAPSWSPDGSRLAIVLTRTGTPKIYISDLAANQIIQITEGYSIDTEPTWSPDGRYIYFTSNRSGKPQIYRIAVAHNRAVSAPERISYSGNYSSRPLITPDGRYLVFLQGGSGYNIAKQDLQSGHTTLLTTHGHAQSPSIAPNSNRVIYAINRNDRQVLAMVSMDGQVQLRLPSQLGNVRDPAWSPFNK